MRMRKLIDVMIVTLAAMLGHAGDSVPFVLDNATSPSGESVAPQWDTEWIGVDELRGGTVVLRDEDRSVRLLYAVDVCGEVVAVFREKNLVSFAGLRDILVESWSA